MGGLDRKEKQMPTLTAVKEMLYGVGAGDHCDPATLYHSLSSDGWVVEPVYYRGLVVGAIVHKGAEIHTSIAPQYHKLWNPIPYIRSILYPALLEYGVINSHAEKEDARAQRWLEKLGFIATGCSETRIFYSLSELPSKFL